MKNCCVTVTSTHTVKWLGGICERRTLGIIGAGCWSCHL